MKLTDLITLESIKLNVEAKTKESVIKELVQVLNDNGSLNDPDQFEQKVHAREEESSTGIGFGIAIPHGKTDAVKEPAVAFGRNLSGVDWDSLDGEDAKLFFMIAVPESNAGNEHLKILQMLSRKLVDDDFRHALEQAKDENEVYTLLGEI